MVNSHRTTDVRLTWRYTHLKTAGCVDGTEKRAYRSCIETFI